MNDKNILTIAIVIGVLLVIFFFLKKEDTQTRANQYIPPQPGTTGGEGWTDMAGQVLGTGTELLGNIQSDYARTCRNLCRPAKEYGWKNQNKCRQSCKAAGEKGGKIIELFP